MEPNKDDQEVIIKGDGDAVESRQIEINSEDGMISNLDQEPASAPEVASEVPESVIESPKLVEEEGAAVEVSAPDDTVQPTSGIENESAVPTPVSPEETGKENPMAIPTQKPHKAGPPKAAIIVAVLIALTLAVVSVVAFMKINESDNADSVKTETASTPQEPAAAPTPVTPEEIDQTVNEIDTEINKTTNDEDIPTSDSVSDQALDLQ